MRLEIDHILAHIRNVALRNVGRIRNYYIELAEVAQIAQRIRLDKLHLCTKSLGIALGYCQRLG